MANHATLKAAIAAAIKQNANNEITGNLLQQILLAMVNSLGAGYQYAGIATPDTNPGTPDQNVFYIASTDGTYTNFGGVILDDGEIAILKYNGAWSKDSTGAATQESVNRLGQILSNLKAENGFYTINAGGIDNNTGADSSLANNCRIQEYLFAPIYYEVYPGIISVAYRYNKTTGQYIDYINITDGTTVLSGLLDDTNYIYRIKFSRGGASLSPTDNIVKILLGGKSLIYLYNKLVSLQDKIDGSQDGLIHFIFSANLHNSAPAVSSETRPDGPDWLAHSMTSVNGVVSNNNTYNMSYYIPVIAGQSYKSNVALRHVAFYKADKSGIEGTYVQNEISAGTEIVAPANAAYIVVQYPFSYSPGDVKFGLYADDINVSYSVGSYNSRNEQILLKQSPEYQELEESVSDLDERVTAIEETGIGKKLKVLLMGSSFGVNTIIQFPALCKAAGIDIVCGNLYKGSCTLADIVDIINGVSSWSASKKFTTDGNSWQNFDTNFVNALKAYDWDIIIVQRAAPGGSGGSDSWNLTMANQLETIIEFIQTNCTKNPKIMFNSVFGRSVETTGSRENQIAQVNTIMSTAKQMQDQFGLDVIPAAIAIQNARNTSLSYVPTSNHSGFAIPDLCGTGDHLDTGVGSYILGCLLYEQIVGKIFNKSILTLDYLPTLQNVHGNAGFSDADFTQITQPQSMIAKYAAMCAVQQPWTVNTALAERYPYPTV